MRSNSIIISLAHLAEVGAEEVEETLVALEALKQLDKALGGELLVVLGGDLDHDLQETNDIISNLDTYSDGTHVIHLL